MSENSHSRWPNRHQPPRQTRRHILPQWAPLFLLQVFPYDQIRNPTLVHTEIRPPEMYPATKDHRHTQGEYHRVVVETVLFWMAAEPPEGMVEVPWLTSHHDTRETLRHQTPSSFAFWGTWIEP